MIEITLAFWFADVIHYFVSLFLAGVWAQPKITLNTLERSTEFHSNDSRLRFITIIFCFKISF